MEMSDANTSTANTFRGLRRVPCCWPRPCWVRFKHAFHAKGLHGSHHGGHGLVDFANGRDNLDLRVKQPKPFLKMTNRWGHETDLAIANFPISGEPVARELIHALVLVKSHAAAVNADMGIISAEVAASIRRAAEEILAGEMADQFPVDVFQTGSGTSTNMNVNEVLAHRASELLTATVHPNDHVNASQSSNDTFPSAIRVSASIAIVHQLLPTLGTLAASLQTIALRHMDTIKMGRTHLMDAVPMTFGQECSAWAAAVENATARIVGTLPRLCELPIGGTAVGTGLNSPAKFGAAVAERLSTSTGVRFSEASNHFEAQATQDCVVETSAMLKVLAISLNKIAGDIRLLSSGPHGGLAEISVPALQAGSSIMPGKINPVIAEVVQQVAAEVVGNDATITFATASCSTLQLTTAMPVIGRSLLASIKLLTNATEVFEARCVRGIEVDVAQMLSFAMSSPAVVTALATRIGYDAAVKLAAEAAQAGLPMIEFLAGRGEHLDLLELARPHPIDG